MEGHAKTLTFTFVRRLSYIASILFTGVKFTSRTYSRENYAVVGVDFHCRVIFNARKFYVRK